MKTAYHRSPKKFPIGLTAGFLLLLVAGISTGIAAAAHRGKVAGPVVASLAVASPRPTQAPATPTQAVTATPSTLAVADTSSSFDLPSNQAIPILMYHYIRDFHDPKDKIGTNLSIAPAVFAQQLAELKAAGYTTVTFKELNKPLPAKPIILTFDDGYEDAYTDALPALQKEHMTAVFYLVSQFINTPLYLSANQAKTLDADGMEIGSHTINHTDLSKQTEAQQLRQLTESKSFLENLIGKPVTAFCYPSGKYNAATLALDSKVGYTTATTTKPGLSYGRDFKTKPYELDRIRMTEGINILKVLGDKK